MKEQELNEKILLSVPQTSGEDKKFLSESLKNSQCVQYCRFLYSLRTETCNEMNKELQRLCVIYWHVLQLI